MVKPQLEHKTHTQSPIMAGGLRPPVSSTTIVNSTNTICQGKHVPTNNKNSKKIKNKYKFQMMFLR